jgi:hypothetical protein
VGKTQTKKKKKKKWREGGRKVDLKKGGGGGGCDISSQLNFKEIFVLQIKKALN